MICHKCKKDLPDSRFFDPKKGKTYALCDECREYVRKYTKKKYWEDKGCRESNREKAKEYYRKNKDHILERMKAKRDEDRKNGIKPKKTNRSPVRYREYQREYKRRVRAEKRLMEEIENV